MWLSNDSLKCLAYGKVERSRHFIKATICERDYADETGLNADETCAHIILMKDLILMKELMLMNTSIHANKRFNDDKNQN